MSGHDVADSRAAIERAIERQLQKFKSAKEEEAGVVAMAAVRRREAQQAAVQMLMEYGLGPTEIGRRVGLSDGRIHQILNG